MTGVNNNDSLALNYILTVFKHICSPVKCNLSRAADFNRQQATKKRRIETTNKQQLAIEAKAKRLQELAEEKKQLEEST